MKPFLTGQQVALRPLTVDDVRGCVWKWNHDKQVTRHLFRGTYPKSPDQAVAEHAKNASRTDEVELIITDAASGEPIGITGLHGISALTRSAEWRILIGRADHWGKGIGREVGCLMVAYGFEQLNLHKVWLGVNASHDGAVRCYDKIGFTREGVLRDEVFCNGQYHDAIRMSMLEEEYRARVDQWPIAEQINQQLRPSD